MEYMPALIAAAATISAIFVAKIFELRTEIQREHRIKKVEVYRKFLGFWIEEVLGRIIEKKAPPSDLEVAKFIKETLYDVMTWGGDNMVRAYSDFRNPGGDPENADPIKMLFAFEKMVYAIRKDLGHKNKQLKKGTILGLFVNDISTFLPENG